MERTTDDGAAPAPAGGGGRVAGGLDLAALAGTLPDAVAVVGPEGRVVWANAEALRLLGTTAEAMVGSDAFGRVHPDELERAAAGIAWSAAFPDRTAVVPYRLRRDDGRYVPVELKATVVAGDGGDHLVLVLRDGSTRTTLAAALASVAEGRPVAETARHLARAVDQRWPGTRAAVVHHEAGQRVVTADGLADELVAWVAGDGGLAAGGGGAHGQGGGGELPWDRVRPGGPSEVVGVDDLPPALSEVARRLGFAACAVSPAVDPAGEPAAVVAWFDEPLAAEVEWAHWAHELTELLNLALDRRHHQAELRLAARRDPLTGLPNRLGFVEAATELLEAGDLGLVYVDLDGFKPVNDRHGHLVGDQVLVAVAGRLAAAVPAGAVLARIGGDEFAVALPLPATGADALGPVADRLLAAVAEPMVVGHGGESYRLALGASAGLAVRARRRVDGPATRSDGAGAAIGHLDAARLLEEADSAMYAAKRAGRGAWCWAQAGA